MNEIIFEVHEDEAEGGFVARALGQSIVTQADTWEELRAKVREAVRCHFEEGQAPRVIRLHRVVEEVLALA
jgi:predicted RNase H-like HicB family nuclease